MSESPLPAGLRRDAAWRARNRRARAPDRRRLPLLLRRAWFGLNQAFRHLAAKSGITPDQFTVLRTLNECGRRHLTQCELAERMSSDPNTITSLLRRMEALGLIERYPHPLDGRARCLGLKPAGRRKFAEVNRLALGLQRTVLGVLPSSRREEFLGCLDQISIACWEAARNGRGRRTRSLGEWRDGQVSGEVNGSA